jgi:hypothetical protein
MGEGETLSQFGKLTTEQLNPAQTKFGAVALLLESLTISL